MRMLKDEVTAEVEVGRNGDLLLMWTGDVYESTATLCK